MNTQCERPECTNQLGDHVHIIETTWTDEDFKLWAICCECHALLAPSEPCEYTPPTTDKDD